MLFRGVIRRASICWPPLRRHFSSSPLSSSSASSSAFDLYNPTPEHAALRALVRDFAASEVEPQALSFNREERFNEALFRRAGELGAEGGTGAVRVKGRVGQGTGLEQHPAHEDRVRSLGGRPEEIHLEIPCQFGGDGKTAQRARAPVRP